MKKVLVAMSGGVDSSTAAYLLLKDEFQASGITMLLSTLGQKKETGDLSLINDAGARAEEVCRQLNISHSILDYTKLFKQQIIDDFVNAYMSGITPNPCVRCNKLIKFGQLFQQARENGFDYLATGHYAQIESIDGRNFIKKAVDLTRDQSYFLYAIPAEILPYIKFPCGNFTKNEIKRIASGLHLPSASAPESRDICFIPDGSYENLIRSKYTIQDGDICDTMGNILGKHKGLAFYTVGQRKGLGIAHEKPLYVLKIDFASNKLVVGSQDEVYTTQCSVEQLNWFIDPGELSSHDIKVRIRYQHTESKADIVFENDSKVHITFKEPQLAITPGQSAVFYDNDIVLGGGVINKIYEKTK